MEPMYISTLLDQTENFDYYIIVGDPRSGDCERIGVIPAMLMAHSVILRSALSIAESELEEQWDLPLTFIRPRTFRHILKYAYGYNRVFDSLPFMEIVEVLVAVHELKMEDMETLTLDLVKRQLTPANVCLALKEPVCLLLPPINERITSILHSSMPAVIKNTNLSLIDPESMRYVVCLNLPNVYNIDLWRAVVGWARGKVLKDCYPVAVNAESLNKVKILIPHLKMEKLCMLDLIKRVENICKSEPFDNTLSIKKDEIANYHAFVTTPTEKVFLCTKNHFTARVVHSEFGVKVINVWSEWSDSILMRSSVIDLTTLDKSYELYSLICSARNQFSEPTKDLDFSQKSNVKSDTYKVKCKVIIKKVDAITCHSSIVSEIEFNDIVMYSEEFHVTLGSNGNACVLESKSCYEIEVNFSSPHPLWHVNHSLKEVDEREICVLSCKYKNCFGGVGFGSHVKYIFYRDV